VLGLKEYEMKKSISIPKKLKVEKHCFYA